MTTSRAAWCGAPSSSCEYMLLNCRFGGLLYLCQLGFGLVPLKLEIKSPSVGILIVITKLRWKVSCLHCPKTYLHWRHCGEKVRNRTFSLLLFLPEKHLFNNFDALNELKPKYLITYCAMLAAAVLSAITRRRTCSK